MSMNQLYGTQTLDDYFHAKRKFDNTEDAIMLSIPSDH